VSSSVFFQVISLRLILFFWRDASGNWLGTLYYSKSFWWKILWFFFFSFGKMRSISMESDKKNREYKKVYSELCLSQTTSQLKQKRYLILTINHWIKVVNKYHARYHLRLGLPSTLVSLLRYIWNTRGSVLSHCLTPWREFKVRSKRQACQ